MENKKFTKEELSAARKEAVFSAMSVNNALTEEYLKTKTDSELLCFIHPNFREQFAAQLGIEYRPKKELLTN